MARPWVSYWKQFDRPIVQAIWRRTFCRAGIHLFDEVYSFGGAHITPGMIALLESQTGFRAEVADPTDTHERRFLYCDACEIEVPIGDDGGENGA